MPPNLHQGLRLAALTLGLLAPCASAASPKLQDLRLEVAGKWEAKGEYEKAAQELRLYLAEHPEKAGPIYARIGGLRLKQGNYKLAGENFKIALAKDSGLAEARAGLATANAKLGEKEGAAVESMAGGSYSPAMDSTAARGPEGIYKDKDFLEALDLYKAGKADAAAAALHRCLARNPGHPGAYYLGGVLRYDKGELSMALYNFKRALAYPERGFNAHFYMGRIYQRQERFPEAAAEYREYLKATQSEAGKRQAESYLAQLGQGNSPATPESGNGETLPDGGKGNPAGAAPGSGLKESTAKEAAHEARPTGETGKPAAPESAEARAHPEAPAVEKASAPVPASEAKALVMGRDGDFLFLIPDPESASGRKLREAHSLVKNGKYENGANVLKEVARDFGGSDNAAASGLDLASVYLQLGLWDQARARAADHLGADGQAPPRYPNAAHYLSALAHLGLRDGDRAEKELLAIASGSTDAPAQEEIDYRLSQAGELLNDPKKWSGYLQRAYARSRDPVRKAGYARDMGALHARFGEPDQAQAWFAKAAAECKDGKDSALAAVCAEAQLRIADLAYGKKDWKGAMARYREFSGRWPGHKESAWVHYQMANIYKASGNFEAALHEYKRVIDNYPDSYWASQAKWKREDAIWRKEYEEVLD